ncbi:uncharacterized protein LOC129363936 isoform X2 [Poeciliopsis prolifica]|uniref:uncharacterized protein LOC129363936 isoform X2 n=1 Tax=Poeciliopsis prolifica TaxID=188132 RepID=UPI0024134070|nr:uncharacterized protein LOC129363936 isoform X2 [Poeciliopsis prolifica]
MACGIFDKLSALILFVWFLQICVASECKSKNIICTEICVAEGFGYKHECPEGSEIAIEGTDKMNLGYADLRKQEFKFLPPVVKMDKHSVITEVCQDLKITCTPFTKKYENLAEETCMNFKSIPEKFPAGNINVSPAPSIHDQSHLGWIAVPVILLLVSGVISYCCRKKHKGGGIFNCLQRNQEGSGFPMVLGDLEGQNNADVRNGEDSRGCGGNDRDTAQSAMSGNKGSPNTTTPSDHNPMNGSRNMNEEPVGINGAKGRGNKRELDGGGAAAHHHAEEQPLLPDQRTANRDFNRSYVAVTLVNELSSNQEPVSRHSATPDADVESTCPEKPTI